MDQQATQATTTTKQPTHTTNQHDSTSDAANNEGFN
jgi:hypothetical protein